MDEQIKKIYDWIIYEAGVQPTPDNHFAAVPGVTPKLNLCLQQRPLEIASVINFLLEKKADGESLNYYGEIGACSGSTTYAINNFLAFKELLIIDDNGEENPDFYITQRRNLERHQILKSIPRVEIIGSSHEERVVARAKQITESNKLDVLFIDGDHSYEGVRQDTHSFYDCVRDGGYILFHDSANIRAIMDWVEDAPKELPGLKLVTTYKFNGSPYTESLPNGIGISIFQKTK